MLTDQQVDTIIALYPEDTPIGRRRQLAVLVVAAAGHDGLSVKDFARALEMVPAGVAFFLREWRGEPLLLSDGCVRLSVSLQETLAAAAAQVEEETWTVDRFAAVRQAIRYVHNINTVSAALAHARRSR